MPKLLFNLYLIYYKIRRVIKSTINDTIIKLYFYLFTPWAIAIAISIWNKYLQSQYFKVRKEVMGEQFAKEWFFNDPIQIYNEHRENVFKDKKLMLKIICCPFLIEPQKYPHTNRIFTANDLWR